MSQSICTVLAHTTVKLMLASKVVYIIKLQKTYMFWNADLN